MSQWFKMHEGTLEDQRLAFIAKRLNVSRTAVQAAWWLVLDMASRAEPRGTFCTNTTQTDFEMMAFVLDEDIQNVTAIILQFKERGMIENNFVSDWAQKQNVTSKGAERQKRYRERNAAQNIKDRNGESYGENVTSDAKKITCDGGGVIRDEEEEEKRREEEEEKKNIPPTPVTGEQGGDFEILFQEFFGKRAGRGKATDSEVKARREYIKLIKAGESHETLCNALQAYSAWCHSEGKAGTRYVKSVAGFLSEGDWKQYAGQQSMPVAPPEKDFKAMCAEKGLKCSAWLEAMAAKIGAGKALSFFGAAEFDGKTIRFQKKIHRDLAIAQHEHAMAEVFGKGFSMEVKNHV